MRKLFKKLNNQGSTLLTVIICIAFIGILGSMMLSVTMTNLQMKLVESKAKKNFYTCEAAMEEIRTGIEEVTAEKIKNVYETKIMTNFANFLNIPNEEDQNKYIKKLVAAEIIKEFGNTSGLTDDQLVENTPVAEQNDDIFAAYLSPIPADANTTRTVTVGIDAFAKPIYSETGESIVIKDIRVTLTKDDYETSITSNIVVTLPNFTFNTAGDETVVYSMEQPYQGYALVADGGIISNHNTGSNTITGSVYAGDNGITVSSQNSDNHHTLNINAGTIVTRGNITAEDKGKLVIRGKDSLTTPMIWADNLMTKNSGLYGPGLAGPTTLDVEGISFIKDDLTLDAVNSVAKITGAYVGYTGVHTEEGSAIMLNGTGSAMDLSGVDSLILAGRAHVSVDDPLKKSNILTGESIAFKSNQRAYLIPGKFIVDYKHNPVTQAELGVNDPQVDFSLPSEINYSDYVNPTYPYSIAAKQTIEGTSSTLLRYCYLNFASGKQADQFLRIFMSKNPTILGIMDPFQLGNVIPPNPGSEVACVGNQMYYNGLTVTLVEGLSSATNPVDSTELYTTDKELDDAVSTMPLDDTIYTNAGLQYSAGGGPVLPYNVGKLSELYSRMNHLLYLDRSRAYQESDQVVQSSVVPGGEGSYYGSFATNPKLKYYDTIELGEAYELLDASDINLSEQSFIIVNGDVVLDYDFNGLLIASGDITINDGVTIKGMVVSAGSIDAANTFTAGDILIQDNVTVTGRIIATGNIELGISDIFNAELLPEDNLAFNEIFLNNGDILEKLFKYMNVTINYTIAEPTEDLALVDLSAMISYENWRKN